MKQLLQVLVFTLLFMGSLQAQVGIGTTSPDASSVLDVTSTEGGMLIPRMTQTERDNINSPATGLLIYQTDNSPGFYYHNGSTWITIISGNTDDGDWTINAGNVERNSGNVLINTTDQSFKLSVAGESATRQNTSIDIGPNTINDNALEINRSYNAYGFGLTASQNSTDIFNNKGAISAYNTLGDFTTNLAYSTNPNASYGIYTRTSSPSLNSHGGFFEVTSNNTAAFGNIQYGIRTNSHADGNGGEVYGTKSEVSGSGTSEKYGFHTIIPVSSNGIHYGVYSDIQNSTGYAGYFIGRTSFGNATTNRYTFPAADGSSGQVLTAAGDGTTSWATVGSVPSTPSIINVNNSAPISIPNANIWTLVTFDTENIDSNSEFDTTTSQFTATTAGYYRVYSNLTFNGLDIFVIGIFVNGILIATREHTSLITNRQTILIDEILNISSLDTIEIQCKSNMGNSVYQGTFSNLPRLSSFQIQKLN